MKSLKNFYIDGNKFTSKWCCKVWSFLLFSLGKGA